jgi:predicted TIM-barrel enzyme
MKFSKSEILNRLKATIAEKRPIIVSGAGTGISASFEEEGGVDLIIIYNSGRYRMAGRSSLAGCLPYGDANAIVMELAGEVLPIVKHTPVIAGVCATDPFRIMDRFLREVGEIGFSGVQNYPTVGLYDGLFRKNLEETGLGFTHEIEMIRLANEMGLFTIPYVFSAEDARDMALAGADAIVCHLGLTVKKDSGAKTSISLEDAVRKVQEVSSAAKAVKADIICLCHGGPISMPEDAEYVLRKASGIHGFCGASSVERLPTELAIKAQISKFKQIKLSDS